MKFQWATSVWVAMSWVGGSSASSSIYRPTKMDYVDILDSNNSNRMLMMDALQNAGMISVTSMPDIFQSSKQEMQSLMHACLSQSGSSKTHVFDDGTQRTTLATHTLAGGHAQPILATTTSSSSNNNIHDDNDDCTSFASASQVFRAHVDRVTRAFAQRLSELCHDIDDQNDVPPLLHTEQGFPFHTLFDVVDNGEHLEHFHDYQGLVSMQDESSSRNSASSAGASTTKTDTTIEWHKDQGLFLAFTPGVLIDHQQRGIVTQDLDGFYIELADGSRPMVQFDSQDDLVFLLGDGIHQMMNGENGNTESCLNKFRATPHALSMPLHQQDQSRVWYGRMVLPPATAIHPKHDQTFGFLRQMLIEESTTTTGIPNKEIMSLGCSGGSSAGYGGSQYGHARQLEETSCEEGTLLCKSVYHAC